MKNVMRTTVYLAVLGSSALTGCASIVNGSNQVISVAALSKTEAVQGATCQLNNGKGIYYVTTPGTVTVNRAYDDMSVKCEKANYEPGLATVKSSTKAMAFGNILFGGPIGAAVDAGTGAAYDYPSLITVMMGESIVLPIQPTAPQAQSAPQPPQAPATVAAAAK